MTAQHLSMRVGPNEPTSVEKAEQTQDPQKSWRIHVMRQTKPAPAGPATTARRRALIHTNMRPERVCRRAAKGGSSGSTSFSVAQGSDADWLALETK